MKVVNEPTLVLQMSTDARIDLVGHFSSIQRQFEWSNGKGKCTRLSISTRQKVYNYNVLLAIKKSTHFIKLLEANYKKRLQIQFANFQHHLFKKEEKIKSFQVFVSYFILFISYIM